MKKLLLLFVSSLLLVGCTSKGSFAPQDGGNEPGGGGSDPGGDPTPPTPPVDTKVFPTQEILSFFEDKGVTGVTIPEYKVDPSNVLDTSVESKIYDSFKVTIQGDISTLYKSEATKAGYSLYGEDTSIYKDSSNKVVFTVSYASIGNITSILYATYDEFSLYYDDMDLPDDGYKYEAVDYTFSVADKMKDYSGVSTDGVTVTSDQINYTFHKEGQFNAPSVYNKNGWHIRFYAGTSITVHSENVTLKKLTFVFLSENNKGTFSADSGEVGYNDDESAYVWTGNTKSVKLTANEQLRFTSIEIKGLKSEKVIPSKDGVSTVAEVYSSIEGYTYTPNSVGWYLTNTEVKLQVKAIDAIDSAADGGEYEPLSKGKVLCADETGAIIVSSSTSSSNPVSLYAAAKKYMNAGSCYEITGKIAFLNDVPEVMVTNYKYNSSLEVEVDINALPEKEISTQEALLADLSSTKTNIKGYGTGKIVKMTGLSYFNKYNSKGSYLFLDRNGKIVPVYSLDDNARIYFSEQGVYDIIGFESMYKGRPSLRILKVTSNSEVEKVSFDFANSSTNIDNLSQFYQLDTTKGEQYKLSELTVYSAEVYVSQYAKDKYTFNTSYYWDASAKHYTTGSSQANAASHNSLGIFNEDLDYKHLFDDLQIDLCSTEDEVKNCKFTIYFTLAYLDTVDSKHMWRVNVFEEMVPEVVEA